MPQSTYETDYVYGTCEHWPVGGSGNRKALLVENDLTAANPAEPGEDRYIRRYSNRKRQQLRLTTTQPTVRRAPSRHRHNTRISLPESDLEALSERNNETTDTLSTCQIYSLLCSFRICLRTFFKFFFMKMYICK